MYLIIFHSVTAITYGKHSTALGMGRTETYNQPRIGREGEIRLVPVFYPDQHSCICGFERNIYMTNSENLTLE